MRLRKGAGGVIGTLGGYLGDLATPRSLRLGCANTPWDPSGFVVWMLPKLKSKYFLLSIDQLSRGGSWFRAREVLTKRVNFSRGSCSLHMDGITQSLPEKEVALVTGGNKGIGLEICKQLACSGVTVVLTARDERKGIEAVGALGALGLSNVLFHQLEVSDPSSAARSADFIKEKFGKLDILVNNAGTVGTTTEIGNPETFWHELASIDPVERLEWITKRTTEPYEKAEECLRTNYHGIKFVTKALLPLLLSSSHGRIVNMSSRYGLLRFFSGEELKQELNDVDNLSEERLDELSELFLKDFKDVQLKPRGWPTDGGYSAYRVSKALMNAYSRILAKEHPSLCINCVHPGYVRTDMNFKDGDLTVEEGARGPLMMAQLPKGGMTGAHIYCTEVSSFM